ncbi:AAA family ATPase [Oenococcus oeni]|uniref:AAA family ATPase n=1 Tax=Oenococcus oeni TaxID=1247 RepID=A0AAJ2P407_OENOE|nr:AAA family ATPase [Oenococcus oeni]MDV7715258.1 AAA family ATPase [Oenococcus oeni]
MKVYNSSDIQIGNYMYLVYGDAGSGKTSTARYLKGRKLLISLDQSQEPAKDWKDTVIAEPEEADLTTPYENITAFFDLVENKFLAKVDVVIIDNVSQLERLVLTELISKYKDNRQAYQAMQEYFRSLATKFRFWHKPIYVTAWEMNFQQSDSLGAQVTQYTVDMNAKARTAFTGLFDLVGRISADHEGKRVIQLQPTDQLFAKNRIDSRKKCLPEHLFDGQEYEEEINLEKEDKNNAI